VKPVDTHTGAIRVIGRGTWWPGATSSGSAARNWWHVSGYESGRRVVADNRRADVAVFDRKRIRTHRLARSHRTCGHGIHPHVSWDRRGEQVVLASHKLGSIDVCVATIPNAWQDEWSERWLSNDTVAAGNSRAMLDRAGLTVVVRNARMPPRLACGEYGIKRCVRKG